MVPLVASLPLHDPLAVHEVALAEDHVSVVVAPSAMLAGFAAIVTVGFGWLLPPHAAASRQTAPQIRANNTPGKGAVTLGWMLPVWAGTPMQGFAAALLLLTERDIEIPPLGWFCPSVRKHPDLSRTFPRDPWKTWLSPATGWATPSPPRSTARRLEPLRAPAVTNSDRFSRVPQGWVTAKVIFCPGVPCHSARAASLHRSSASSSSRGRIVYSPGGRS